MRLFRMSVSILVLTGCAWNVESFERDVTSESDAAPFVALRAEAGEIGAPVAGTDVVVNGAERETVLATMRVAGLAGANLDPETVPSHFAVTWPVDASGVRELRVAYDGEGARTMWIERTTIEMPRGADLELVTGGTSAEVSGLAGAVAVTSEGGAIDVRGGDDLELRSTSGAIHAEGRSAAIDSDAGEIDVVLAAALVARTTSGAIRGSFGAGGTIATQSGAVDVSLTSALDRDLTITGGVGPVRLGVPSSIAARLEATSDDGGVHVDAAGLAGEGTTVSGALGTGGPFTIRLRSTTGSITVYQLSDS